MAAYLVITELFLPTKGGTAIWFAESYARLGGRETHIVTAAVDGQGAVDGLHPNTIHRLKLRRYAWLKPESLWMYLKLFVCCFWLAVSRRFVAIHAGRVLPEGLIAWLVARLTRHRCVIYAHGEELTSWGTGTKYRVMCFTLRRADTVIANSEFTRDELLKMGVDSAALTIIYPGVDVARFQPGLEAASLRAGLGLGPGQSLVLSVGRMQKRKGFDMIMRAMPALLATGIDAHYALIGQGELQPALDDLARSLGLTDRVHFLGHVSMHDLPRWYNACDVFAMPNREIDGDTEGFGMVFLEAAACGKPVVAGIAGGTGSAVADGDTGLRVDGESVDAVAGALLHYLQDPVAAARAGLRARDRVLRYHSWDEIARKTAALA